MKLFYILLAYVIVKATQYDILYSRRESDIDVNITIV